MRLNLQGPLPRYFHKRICRWICRLLLMCVNSRGIVDLFFFGSAIPQSHASFRRPLNKTLLKCAYLIHSSVSILWQKGANAARVLKWFLILKIFKIQRVAAIYYITWRHFLYLHVGLDSKLYFDFTEQSPTPSLEKTRQCYSMKLWLFLYEENLLENRTFIRANSNRSWVHLITTLFFTNRPGVWLGHRDHFISMIALPSTFLLSPLNGPDKEAMLRVLTKENAAKRWSRCWYIYA